MRVLLSFHIYAVVVYDQGQVDLIPRNRLDLCIGENFHIHAVGSL